jgi:drug/metabolite transporter (DMT)-like permease
MWFLLATVASMFWGISYIVSEHLYKRISVYTTLAIETFFISIIILTVAILTGDFKRDMTTLGSSSNLVLLLAASTIIWAIAELAINLSISERNATLAGFVEITYPFFIAVFAFVFFGQKELHVGTALGSIMIFMGACVIFYFGR